MIIDFTPELAEATRNVLDANQPYNNAITASNVAIGVFTLLVVILIIVVFGGNKANDLDNEVIDVAGTTVSRPGKTKSRIIMTLIVTVAIAFVAMFATGIYRTLSKETLNSSAESLVTSVEDAVNETVGMKWVTSDPDIDDNLVTVSDKPVCLIAEITEDCSGGFPAATVAVETEDDTENVDVIVSIDSDAKTLMLQTFTVEDVDDESENQDEDN